MSKKWPGGIITPTPATPTGPYQDGKAPGIWTLSQQSYWAKQSLWPIAGNVVNYIEDVFSTYLLTGNASTQTITNGIDLSTYGGLVWSKNRTSASTDHCLNDSARNSFQNRLVSNATSAQDVNFSSTEGVTSVSSTGFVFRSFYGSPDTYVTWTFRKQPKFFDVVTWTGDGVTTGRQISHSLASTVGCIIAKNTSASDDWYVWHRGLSSGYWISLNQTAAQSNFNAKLLFGNGTVAVDPTSSVFTVGSGLNTSGQGFVAYLYAHDAGGFGLTGTDNVISCGSLTASGGAASVTLGYEPQWLMFKRYDGGGGNWSIIDSMRNWNFSATAELIPNSSAAEDPNAFIANPTSTGFSFGTGTLAASGSYIYIAIRRGPMKVPTVGTTVFAPVIYTGNDITRTITTNFPVSQYFIYRRDALSTSNISVFDRLRGSSQRLLSSGTSAETSDTTFPLLDSNTGVVLQSGVYNTAPESRGLWAFQRAPGFFDEVCYTGTGSATTQTHNLGVAPELIIVKRRAATTGNWLVYTQVVGPTQYLTLNTTNSVSSGTNTVYWNNTSPTASVFTVGTSAEVNASGGTYVSYLFATTAGVSKVGSYTGTGATQTIACGFTGSARFVLIKRTDSAGDWWVWDTARGMVSGTDPSLKLNSTAAEVNANSVYTATGGFQIVSTVAGINASGGTYIFLAIA